MPIYAFECANCGHSFDRLQKLSDPDPDACPSCEQPSVHRRLTAPAFRLAGSGWYETDFKREGEVKRNLAGDGGEGRAKAESGPASKDSGPAASSTSKDATGVKAPDSSASKSGTAT